MSVEPLAAGPGDRVPAGRDGEAPLVAVPPGGRLSGLRRPPGPSTGGASTTGPSVSAKSRPAKDAGPRVGRPLWVRAVGWTAMTATVACLGGAAWWEMRTSSVQSQILARLGRDLTWQVQPGPSANVRFPEDGPYDHRLGYDRVPQFTKRLTAGPYAVAAQAHPSPVFRDYMDFGGFAPYREKSSGGLTVLDRTGAPLFAGRFPERTYARFADVPPVVAGTLLFIENRELLDPTHPNRNPAVEWDRFALALLSVPLRFIDPDSPKAGGSTLATQIEKYRHSPDGRTTDGAEKLRQMMSASVRAYLDGADTTAHRHRIVVDYLNSTPLSARPGIGEINGIGDGLWAWFGTDFALANRLLAGDPQDETELARKAIAYKQVLALLIAQRRPSYYLAQDRQALEELANQHLTLLEQAGVISPALADSARYFPLRFRPEPPSIPEPSFVEQKATNAIRNRLLGMLGVNSLYELDRLDLTVETTLDQPTQERVTQVLKRLGDPSATAELGLVGDRLLGAADPSKVVYSVTLYERGPTANLVRVQVDTLDRPMDLNEGAKLDLGSTAKLRTLASYLEIVARQVETHRAKAPHELEAVAADSGSRLTQWTLRTLAALKQQGTEPTTEAVLELAMERQYSASPAERFFTGGGLHVFGNFDEKDDSRIVTVAEAFRHSINLPFIRLMRDIVNHYIAEGPARKDDLLDDPRHPVRQMYLARFADQEGTEYLNRFWTEYRGLDPDKALEKLVGRMRPTPERLAAIFRIVRPNAAEADLRAFLAAHLPSGAPGQAQVQALFGRYEPAAMPLHDRAYLAGLHPLELWLVAYIQDTPKPQRSAMLKESSAPRQESYNWLFTSRSKRAQDTRIGIMLEEEAFDRIHAEWKRLGYPFESLIASYATAVGSSADRPGALADLMGVIVNDGVRLPTARVTRLHFAAGTPFETDVAFDDTANGAATGTGGERVMQSAVASVLRRHLADIVDNGTARRVRAAFHAADGQPIAIGGKTGTGDHRFETFGPGGTVIESRVVNRTATFVFYVGTRFFGVVTAHVHGPDAANYKFTSALPAQLLKSLAPALEPLINGGTQTAESPPARPAAP